MRRNTLLLFAAMIVAASTALAQTPEPVVVQAANVPAETNAAAASAVTTATSAGDAEAATLKALQDIKKANDETLAKQEATLKTIEELEKAAEQLRIFAKRG